MPLPLSVPYGATWKYLLGVGPAYAGFGLDAPPAGADADPAQPGYDDSAWSSGVTHFHNDWGGTPGTPTGTLYTGGRIWARLQARTHGGDLTIAGVVDNTGWFFLDGVFITGRSDLGSVLPFVIHPVSRGLHTFAFYTAGDATFDQAGWTIDEGPFTKPRLRQFPRDDQLGHAPRQGRTNNPTSVQGSARQGWANTYR